MGATVLAGCTTEDGSDDGTGSEEENGSDSETAEDLSEDAGGNFRLLVTDLPADIGDFERLDVSFSHARVFDGGPADGSEQADDNESDAETGVEDERDGEQDDDQQGNDEEFNSGIQRQRGFYRLDLDGATVDLTQVVGDRAISVFEGDLSEGEYNKIELHVSDIEGIVDGEQAEVNVPSEKLQITHGFEIRAEETTEFVFDINVVQRGQGLRYNLTPVISGSGMDIGVEEIDRSEENGQTETDNQTDESTADDPDE